VAGPVLAESMKVGLMTYRRLIMEIDLDARLVVGRRLWTAVGMGMCCRMPCGSPR